MESQLDLFQELPYVTTNEEERSYLAFLHQLQLGALQPPHREEDAVSTSFAASETFAFTQTPSVSGESLLDVCTPPLSPYSQASHPSSFANVLSIGGIDNGISPAQSEDQGQQQIPVCYDFVQGRCVRSNCRYSHDLRKLERPNRNVQKKGICFDYLRGDCHRGALCRFTHDVRSFAQADTIDVDDDISLAKVKRWGQGICFDFVRGACTRGCKCPWSHNLLEIAVATKKGIETMETSERNNIADTVRQRLRGSLENKDSVHETPTAPVTPRSDYNLEQMLVPLEEHVFTGITPRQAKNPQWIALWNYPEGVFGPLDDFGRPLHWLINADTDLMNLNS
eukprot:g4092.t1